MIKWSRKQAIATMLPLDKWPGAITDGLDREQREQYEARVNAINRYFSGQSSADISKVTGVSRTRLADLAKKCLLPASDGNIWGYRALLPYTRLKEYERTAAEKRKFPEQKGGYAGMLKRLLARYPDIEETLVMRIFKEAKHLQVPEHKLRARDLHRIFILLLREKEAPRTEWPFTTKFRGKRSIECYMRRLLDENFAKGVNRREDADARAHVGVGTGHQAFLSYDEPYAAIEIDAYDIESHLTAAFKTPEGTETDVLLERLWLLAAVDRFSSAILAYSVVYRSEVNADDVLHVIRQAATGRWKPLELTIPALRYPPDGGLPTGVIPSAHGAIWSCMLFDGALAHLSKTVHERARKVLGCVVNWGPVRHFERRPNVERLFDQIAVDLFKRLPSTTGSGPKNGRADNAEAKAIRYKIRADEVEQLLDVTVAQYNATPSEGNSFLSPLDVLRYFLDDPEQRFLVRRLPSPSTNSVHTFASREIVTVRGGRRTGRRPYVQIDRVHYTSPVLANAGYLVNQTLIVEIDNEDMRQVKAFLANGAELGVLKAKGKWGRTKHSRRTRAAINSLISKRVITVSEFDDPVQLYMSHLAQRPKKENGAPITPRQATELVRSSREAGERPRLPSPKPAMPQPIASLPSLHEGLMKSENTFFTKVKNRR